MISFTDKEYKKRIAKLPEELKKVINSFDSSHFVSNIYSDYQIKYPPSYSLTQNLYAVLIGLLPPHEFKDELIKDGMDPEVAEKVSQRVHYHVFREVKKELWEIYAEI